MIRAHAIGEIVEIGVSNWSPGELVYSFFRWQEFHLATVEQIMCEVDTDLAPGPAWLGPLGPERFDGMARTPEVHSSKAR